MLDLKERVEDVIKNARDRLTNPFFYSFILSWLIWNWEVTVALLWYDAQQIKAAGYSNIFTFISCKTNSVWLPIISAIGYTILAPFFRNGLSILHSWVNGIGNTYSFKFSKDSPVKVERYMNLRDEYQKKEILVSNLINTETDRNKIYEEREKQITELQSDKLRIQKEFFELQENSLKLKTEINQAEENGKIALHEQTKIFQTQLSEVKDITPFIGRWEVTYKDKSKESRIILIKRDKLSANFGQISFPQIVFIDPYVIVSFAYQKNIKELMFVARQASTSYRLFYELVINDDTHMNGFENEDEVTFIKQEPSVTVTKF